MGYAMNPMEQQMAMQALMQGFMNEVDVIMQAYGDYDKHFLGILDKAKYTQRLRRVALLSKVYIEITLEKNTLERRLKELDERIEIAMSNADRDAWTKLKRGTWRLFKKHEDILSQTEAQIAAFRSMALVKAFEQFSSDSSEIVGVPAPKFAKIQAKAKADDSKRKGATSMDGKKNGEAKVDAGKLAGEK